MTTPRLVSGRQYELIVETQVNLASDLANGVRIDLPPSACITGVEGNVLTAFNGTAPTFTLADNSTTPVDYFNAASGSAVGPVAGNTAAIGLFYPAGAELTFSVGGTVSPTTGVVLIAVRYYIDGRSNESYTK